MEISFTSLAIVAAAGLTALLVVGLVPWLGLPSVGFRSAGATVRRTRDVASNGTIGVTYYDLRNNTSAPRVPTDDWFVHCHSSCTDPSNWSETHVAGSFDLEQAAVAGGYFLGD